MTRRRRQRSTPPRPRSGPAATLGRRARLDAILTRDGDECVWCGRRFDDRYVMATTEHVVPRVKGGPSWIENEVAACRRCNGRRGHRTPADWATACDELGWVPDRRRLVRVLEELERTIAVHGGQRRARPYVRSQLRRLRRSVPEAEVRVDDSCTGR